MLLCADQVNESLRSAVAYNQQILSPGANYMLINGLTYDINAMDFFGEPSPTGPRLQMLM
jgi:hypothetical protein